MSGDVYLQGKMIKKHITLIMYPDLTEHNAGWVIFCSWYLMSWIGCIFALSCGISQTLNAIWLFGFLIHRKNCTINVMTNRGGHWGLFIVHLTSQTQRLEQQQPLEANCLEKSQAPTFTLSVSFVFLIIPHSNTKNTERNSWCTVNYCSDDLVTE